MKTQTIDEVIARLPKGQHKPLSPPTYINNRVDGPRVGLAVDSMKHHMTTEGFSIFQGLEHQGYKLFGHGFNTQFVSPDGRTIQGNDWVDVDRIIRCVNPLTVVIQDQVEWDLGPRDFRDPRAKFENVGALRDHPNIFKVTIRKDAHAREGYNAEASYTSGIHAWVVYYNPKVICHLAGFLRPEHTIRTTHDIDPDIVPPYRPSGREGCLLSGAMGRAYPLRTRLMVERESLPFTTYLPHPGYHRKGSNTPEFLQRLSKFKVAICTSSMYSYSLRKMIEATACGCIVITDLASDEMLPAIDGNLVRIHPETSTVEIAYLIDRLCHSYNPALQESYSNSAIDYYDWRKVGKRLADNIEKMRASYGS